MAGSSGWRPLFRVAIGVADAGGLRKGKLVAISRELAAAGISLKDLDAARNPCRGHVRQELTTRRSALPEPPFEFHLEGSPARVRD